MPSILEPSRHIVNGHVGSLRPAFRRDEAVARIDSHHDPARELTCGVLHEFRVLERRRADHHTRYTQVKPALHGGPFTDAPAKLHMTGKSFDDALHRSGIHRPSCNGPIQPDRSEESRAWKECGMTCSYRWSAEK